MYIVLAIIFIITGARFISMSHKDKSIIWLVLGIICIFLASGNVFLSQYMKKDIKTKTYVIESISFIWREGEVN